MRKMFEKFLTTDKIFGLYLNKVAYNCLVFNGIKKGINTKMVKTIS